MTKGTTDLDWTLTPLVEVFALLLSQRWWTTNKCWGCCTLRFSSVQSPARTIIWARLLK